jgi:hypothetical protein
LQKLCKLWSVKCNSTGLHPPNLHDRSQTKVMLFGCTPLSRICSKCLRDCLPCPCMTSPKYVIPKHHITWWHLVELSQSILHAPTLWIHVDQAIPCKSSWFAAALNELLMSTHALFNCTNDGRFIEHPHKSSTVWPYTFLPAPMMAHALSIPTKVAVWPHTFLLHSLK